MTRPNRRPLKAFAACAILLFFAAACSSAGNPIGYDDQKDLNPETGLSVVETNWLAGCKVSVGEDLADSANSICDCSYREITRVVDAETGERVIPFDDFVEADKRLRSDFESLADSQDNPASTEAKLLAIVARCIEQG